MKTTDSENANGAGNHQAPDRKVTHLNRPQKVSTKDILRQIPKKTFHPFWVEYCTNGKLHTQLIMAVDPGNAQAKCLAQHPKATINRAYRTSNNPKEPAICVYPTASTAKIIAEFQPYVKQDEFGFIETLSFREREKGPASATRRAAIIVVAKPQLNIGALSNGK
jgi:hypothetical protein